MAEKARLRVSPYARRTARELGIELDGLSGTGPGRRIVWRDVDAAYQKAQEAPAGGAAAGYYATADVRELLRALASLNGALTFSDFVRRAADRLNTPTVLGEDGVEGVLPQLRSGETAVLAVGAPADGRVRIHLAYDPRALTDGAAAALLRSMRERLENPLLMLA